MYSDLDNQLDFAQMLSELGNEKYLPVQIDVQDKWGKTPLHEILERSNWEGAKMLIRRGANPNLANAKGLTPLHIFCDGFWQDDAVQKFFDINNDFQLTVPVDARDNLDRTPLQLAVANLSPHHCEITLESAIQFNDESSVRRRRRLAQNHLAAAYLDYVRSVTLPRDESPSRIDVAGSSGETSYTFEIRARSRRSASFFFCDDVTLLLYLRYTRQIKSRKKNVLHQRKRSSGSRSIRARGQFGRKAIYKLYAESPEIILYTIYIYNEGDYGLCWVQGELPKNNISHRGGTNCVRTRIA
ncbi:unnamed protein product [Trichogramma brassicae]|uniref:Uncharacterized protein n=1 Tax=Trichogramma brassicae TaxID=86971 RepID=A0A6H5IFE9_9HYME|nr:unnamed protein product [Trichogramma brassicae]